MAGSQGDSISAPAILAYSLLLQLCCCVTQQLTTRTVLPPAPWYTILYRRHIWMACKPHVTPEQRVSCLCSGSPEKIWNESNTISAWVLWCQMSMLLIINTFFLTVSKQAFYTENKYCCPHVLTNCCASSLSVLSQAVLWLSDVNEFVPRGTRRKWSFATSQKHHHQCVYATKIWKVICSRVT